MKNKFITYLLASSIVASIALFGTGCSSSDSTSESKSKKADTETTVSEIVIESTEAEETAYAPSAEVSGILDDKIVGIEWRDTDDGDIDGATSAATYTNVKELKIVYEYSDDYSSSTYEILYNGENIDTSGIGYWGFIKLDQTSDMINDFGFLPTGEYVVNMYVDDELINTAVANVVFDEETAEIPSILTKYYTEYTFSCYHYNDSDFSSYVDGLYTNYNVGDAGFYLTVNAPMVSENGTYVVDLSYNGEKIDTQEYSYEGFENSYANIGFEVDGGLKAGTYEIDYNYEGELFGHDTITVK